MIKRLGNYALLGPALVALLLLGALAASRGLDEAALEADYAAFLTGGKVVAMGNAATLYSPALQTTVQQALLAGSDIKIPGGLLGFVNPPFVALPFVPLSYLSPGIGFIIWNTVQIIAILISLWLLRILLPPERRDLLWLGATIFLPTYQSIFQGQFSPLLLLSVTLLWKGLRSGGVGDWWAGAALGLMLFKPQLLPVFLLFLLYKRNFRAIVGFAAVSVGAYLLSALIAGFGWPGSYLDMLTWLTNLPYQAENEQIMPNLLGLLARFGIHNNALLLLLSLPLIAAFIYACWRSDHITTPTPHRDGAGGVADFAPDGGGKGERIGTLELQLAAATLVAAFTCLYLHDHDLTILMFCGAVLLGWAVQHGGFGWAAALPLGLFIAPLTLVFGPPAAATLLVLIMTIVFGALLYILVHSQPALQPAGEAVA